LDAHAGYRFSSSPSQGCQKSLPHQHLGLHIPDQNHRIRERDQSGIAPEKKDGHGPKTMAAPQPGRQAGCLIGAPSAELS